jgi:ParB family chromosome partitioning protein
VLVRKDQSGNGFLLIAGERRWRAAKAAGLREIPARMPAAEDAIEVARIENVQRQNLRPIEEAEALMRLKQARDFTDGQLAKIIGKPRSSVTELLSLNQLPENIKARCRSVGRRSKSQFWNCVAAAHSEIPKRLANR